MTFVVNTGAGNGPGGPGQAVSHEMLKQSTLRMCDLNLLNMAAHYDLSDKADQKRSVEDLARFFFRACQALAPDLFIEAGAKDARASRRAGRYLEQSRIVAFEANPHTHRAHQAQRSHDSTMEYLNLALSDEPGPLTFNAPQADDGRPALTGIGSIMEHGPNFETNFAKVTVEATTLDRFFADYRFDSCALWIDVEGATGNLLRGGAELLQKASVVIVEVEDRALWKDAWTRPEVTSFLYDAGMLPVARDFQSRYQYNIVFVRESLLDHPYLRWRFAEDASVRAAGQRSADTSSQSAPAPTQDDASGNRLRPAWLRR